MARLRNYDPHEVASVAIKEGFFEEAYQIQHHNGNEAEAAKILIENMKDLDLAADFASKYPIPAVLSQLGHAQLTSNNTKGAIYSFLPGPQDTSAAEKIIHKGKFEEAYHQASVLSVSSKSDSSIWSAMCRGSIKLGNFEFARRCVLASINDSSLTSSSLNEIVACYESHGHISDLIKNAGIGIQRAYRESQTECRPVAAYRTRNSVPKT
ncbi:unnamed protein product [Sphagnum compactum]